MDSSRIFDVMYNIYLIDMNFNTSFLSTAISLDFNEYLYLSHF